MSSTSERVGRYLIRVPGIHIHTTLEKQTHAWLKLQSQKSGKSMSWWIEKVVLFYRTYSRFDPPV